jgi:integrase/recombinase XerD
VGVLARPLGTPETANNACSDAETRAGQSPRVTHDHPRSPRKVLNAWLAERAGNPTDPLFPTTTGKHLSRDAIERRLARHLVIAAERCPSLKHKHVTMHTLRHTAAMRLLLSGNDVTVIALWLGHEQISSTNAYLHADMGHKQQAIDRTNPLPAKPGRYQPPDTLMRFLEEL